MHTWKKNKVKIDKLVTDRQVQVASYMANEKPHVEHSYDVWHVAKGNILILVYNMQFSRPYQLVIQQTKVFSFTFLKTRFINIFTGEKKKLIKVAKKKKFKSIKPWIGVCICYDLCPVTSVTVLGF